MLLSSNTPFSEWEQTCREPMTAAAAIDRQVHHSMIVELNIPSYRLDATKGAQQGSPAAAENSRGFSSGLLTATKAKSHCRRTQTKVVPVQGVGRKPRSTAVQGL